MADRTLILIKHAAPLVIPSTPSEQWKLSDRGRESCAPLAEAVRQYSPMVIVSSDEAKARETVDLIGQVLSLPVETAPGLHEHDRSNVPHMRSSEFISYVELFFRKPAERVLGRESADEALERFESAVAAAISRHPTGNIAIISHGTVLALFVAKHTGERGFDWWRKLGLPSIVVMKLPGYEVEHVVERI